MSRRGHRVVVADNDPEALDLVVLDLRLEGHDVVGHAADAEGAVRVCVEFEPDVLVIDYRMPPGPNGLDAVRRIREVLPGVRCILYTNYLEPELAWRAQRAGCSFLAKGDLRALRRAVSDALREG